MVAKHAHEKNTDNKSRRQAKQGLSRAKHAAGGKSAHDQKTQQLPADGQKVQRQVVDNQKRQNSSPEINESYGMPLREIGKNPIQIPQKKKKSAWKVTLIFFGVIIAVLASVAAVYVSMVHSNLGLDKDETTALDKSVSPVESGQPFYTLVLGYDSYDGTADEGNGPATEGARSDTILLIRTDPRTDTLTLVSVPRDTAYYPNGVKTKINEAFAKGGPAGAVDAVETLTGVQITYYAQMSVVDLVTFIDRLGGITVDVPVAFTGNDIMTNTPISLEAGEQRLDGRKTVLLARQRHAYTEIVRQSNTRLIVKAIIDEVKVKPLYELPGLVLDLSKCVKTNMSVTELITMAQYLNGKNTTIYSCTGPAEGGLDEDGWWYCFEDPQAWADLMEKVDSGLDPNQ